MKCEVCGKEIDNLCSDCGQLKPDTVKWLRKQSRKMRFEKSKGGKNEQTN